MSADGSDDRPATWAEYAAREPSAAELDRWADDLIGRAVLVKRFGWDEFRHAWSSLAIARTYPGGVVFFAGSTLIEVAAHLTENISGNSTTALWLQVRDLEATQRDLAASGAAIVREARTEPWGLREMHILDPDHRQLIFVEIPADHPLRSDQRPQAVSRP